MYIESDCDFYLNILFILFLFFFNLEFFYMIYVICVKYNKNILSFVNWLFQDSNPADAIKQLSEL